MEGVAEEGRREGNGDGKRRRLLLKTGIGEEAEERISLQDGDDRCGVKIRSTVKRRIRVFMSAYKEMWASKINISNDRDGDRFNGWDIKS